MLAYVDESGCTGMRLDSGASKFYVVTAVIFRDRNDAESCYKVVERALTELRVTKEFKFSKLSHPKRLDFFARIAASPFEYVATAFDKARINRQELTLSDPFLHMQVKAIFGAVSSSLNQSTIVIDKTGSSSFRKTLAAKLKEDLNRELGYEAIRKIKELESHKHCLLQLADMVCGAVARSLDAAKKGSDVYRKAICNGHERAVVLWPSPPADEGGA
jgi:hypothetical protein